MAKPHRFERSEADLRRSKPKKRLYDRMLIVCEGEKTEVNYFMAIRRELRIPSADIEVIHSDLGTAPLQIIESAEARFRVTKAFDRVYAVFDRDDHLSYNNALLKAAALDGRLKNDEGTRVPFRAIPSVPNFEFWILLHFKDVLAFMPRADVYTELRKAAHYPTYAKNSMTVYADTKDRIHDATRRAERLRLRFGPYTGTDPYTDADILTNEMATLADRLRV